jgi:hypothetical protein
VVASRQFGHFQRADGFLCQCYVVHSLFKQRAPAFRVPDVAACTRTRSRLILKFFFAGAATRPPFGVNPSVKVGFLKQIAYLCCRTIFCIGWEKRLFLCLSLFCLLFS